MEGGTDVKPALNGKIDEANRDIIEAGPDSTGLGGENNTPGADATAKEEDDSEKKVPISAHQREESETTSARVKEGKQWNDRDRPKYGQRENKTPNKFVRNNKFDPTSLPESDDPVAIRKQVKDSCCSFIRLAYYPRLSSTFRTPTS